MKIGDYIYGGIYAGDHDGHYIICSPFEYELPFEVNWYQAVEYCKSIGMELPTRKELNLLYELSKLAPGQFRTEKWTWYWSSTENSSTDAWGQYFTNGSQNYDYKTISINVRAVRRIKIES